jgi:ribosome recycling factor
MIPELIKDAEHRMTKAVDAAQHDFSTIRTGRANPIILDGVQVEYYGTRTPLNQLAGVSAPEPRMLVITPWDKGSISAIEKAIMNSDVGITPQSDGNVIRLNVPYLTEERRKEFIKILHKKVEDHKIAVRNIRRDSNEHLKDLEKKKEISEDDNKRAQDQIQKLTDKYTEQIEQHAKIKEAELMEV